jgi:hypothetical protein
MAGTAARPGLNAVLSYPGADGAVHAFRVRAERLTHDLKPVYAESSARTRRALYPHRMSDTRFALGLVLVNQAERQALTGFLGDFCVALLTSASAAAPVMDVSVPVRGFVRRGIPLSGFEWGARVGQSVFRPTVVFETSWNPIDGPSDAVPSGLPSTGAVGDPAVQYFFPSGTQLSGDQAAGALPGWAQVLAGIAHLLDPASWGQ